MKPDKNKTSFKALQNVVKRASLLAFKNLYIPNSIRKQKIDIILYDVEAYVVKQSDCPHCDTKCWHDMNIPVVRVFVYSETDDFKFQIKMHDTEQPYKCHACGTEFMLEK